MNAAYIKFRRFFQNKSTLEDLLADDMIQSMMKADNVSPNLVRVIFFEMKERREAWTSRSVKHQLRTLFRRALDCFLLCSLPSGLDGHLQNSLLVIGAAVAWLALGCL